MLEEGATLARTLAPLLCHSPNGRDTCAALHGVWTELRTLGLAAEPSRHATFYAETLGACVARGATRVLISACADWGMLETVLAAYREFGANVDVTVVDRCPTPTLTCAWYASRVGVPVRTAVGDVLEWGEDEDFDVVCTHSLLTYPDDTGRRKLIANWQRVLRPGGAVVTVSRLSTDPVGDVDDARARSFGDLAVAARRRIDPDADCAELRAGAERFAKAQVSNPVGTEADLRSLFEDQGFVIHGLGVRRLEGVMSKTAPVVGAARPGQYGELLAVRQ